MRGAPGRARAGTLSRPRVRDRTDDPGAPRRRLVGRRRRRLHRPAVCRGPPCRLLSDAGAGGRARAPVTNGEFDSVVSVLTHTHFDDPWRAFAEAQRVLRVGGTFVY